MALKHIRIPLCAPTCVLLIWPEVALAHTAVQAGPARDAGVSAVDAFGALLLALVAVAYGVGQWRLAQRARVRRKRFPACFWTGWVTLAFALGSPLDAWSSVSFAAHMAQHELMMLVAAPLLVVARPLGTLVWGLPNSIGALLASRALRRMGGWLAVPLVAWILHVAVLWGWHVPSAFEAGLHSVTVHWLQHASFFGAAVIYWWSVFSSSAGAERKALVLVSVFTTAIHTAVLGMLLTFSTRVWYPTYARTPNAWGLSAVEDQQLGGLIMWVPGGMVFIVAALAVAALWLKQSELRTARG